ncbi:Uma2 family endonuclease [Desulforamulus aquiferis]|uniref:Uma2 family endonuclease n=1 Tax=Desulforamulus aquiferis TaxID=1397668 RepID=A0AAW7ZC30_9FIRM|nr:Uma2 family endonuclease [Desulforamulus aquiferis]MDO7786877.1 Uma2 family endonuclease [Desulforamulus aquiferis]
MAVIPGKHQRYSYQDYKQWPMDKQWELIEGVAYALSPAPSTEHQLISGNLFFIIKSYLRTFENDCMVFYSPYDVLLKGKEEDEDNCSTVVQPDLLVVCDKSKIKAKYCLGAPDWIVEISSPSAPSMDYVKKLHLYEKHGVREYWIINPQNKQVMIFRLRDNGEYDMPEIYIEKGIANVGVFEGLKIKVEDLI